MIKKYGLTISETNIVILRCEHGMSIKEIADARSSSCQTIKNHMSSILKKTKKKSSASVCYEWGLCAGMERNND